MSNRALLYFGSGNRATEWKAQMEKLIPSLTFRVWPDVGDINEVHYVLSFRPPSGVLNTLPNLKVMFCAGAGVDAFLADPVLPAHIPLVKLVEEGLTRGMTEYVVMQVLCWHRDMYSYLKQQQDGLWNQLPQVLWDERNVGIMGMGELGRGAARVLTSMGFPVFGWVSTMRDSDIKGVTLYAGMGELEAFLSNVSILVILLPLTSDTMGLLNAKTLQHLPKGSFVVNAARGPIIVLQDLIQALDSGHLAGATLDVFDEEPLPTSSPLWTHPKVVITPHVAARTVVAGSAAQVSKNIQKFEQTGMLDHIVPRDRGY
eukprot:ANDGO_06422.mRNA.1 Glyoxylate/hydroxypyruvate reductase A